MVKKFLLVFISVICFGSTGVCFSAVTGYENFTDWMSWSRLKRGVSSRMASSYDRSDDNADYSNYESPTGHLIEPQEVTVKTIQGPGIITRFWMPHVMSRKDFVVKMYFDGEQVPRIDTDSSQLFSGNYSYINTPYLFTCAGGQVCYEPISFEESVVIKSYNKDISSIWSNRHYYQYTYSLYPEGTDIETYSSTLGSEENQKRIEAADVLSNVGVHPGGVSETSVEVNTVSEVIGAGAELVMADLTGPGLVRRINVKMAAGTDAELEGLVLRVYYDGSSEAAIDVPVGLFFGAGRERAAYKSLVMGTDSEDGFYCYLPMPYRESVRIVLVNTAGTDIGVDAAGVEYEQGQIDDDLCYLYTQVNTSLRTSGSQIFHTIVSDQGCGHYIGSLLYCEQEGDSLWFLEGDDHITVDGEVVQYGTGLEDTYNGGAYYNWVAVQEDEPEGVKPQSATRAFHGILYVNKEPPARADQYRWRIVDCIPFSESIEVKVENRYASISCNPVWTSVGFYYKYECLREDINEDCIVNFEDFSLLIDKWME